MRDVARIAFNRIVTVYFDAHFLQLILELNDSRNFGIMSDHDAANIKSAVSENTDETEHVHIIRDSKVIADLIFGDIRCVDRNNDLSLVGKLHQHAQLAVRLEARKNSGGMVIVKQFTSEFQI